MADNYLEKRFEEHLKAPSKPARKYVPVHERRCVVVGCANGLGGVVAKALRVAGNKVLLADAETDSCGAPNSNAARTACCDFLPVCMQADDVFTVVRNAADQKWGGADTVVMCVDAAATADKAAGASHVAQALYFAYSYLTAAVAASCAPHPFARLLCVVGGPDGCREETMALGAALSDALASYIAADDGCRSGFAANVVSYVGSLSPLENAAPISRATDNAARAGRPDDVARLVRFLVDEQNDYICGQNIVLNGGRNTF